MGTEPVSPTGPRQDGHLSQKLEELSCWQYVLPFLPLLLFSFHQPGPSVLSLFLACLVSLAGLWVPEGQFRVRFQFICAAQVPPA